MSDDLERWRLVRNAFERCLSLVPRERQGFLESLEPALRGSVEALLLGDEVGLEPPPLVDARDPHAAASLGDDSFIAGYSLLERIGAGGQGCVYRGVRASTGGFVAIKVLYHATEGEALRRLEREIDLLTQLDHPAIVNVTDRGRTTTGQAYLVMELVSGLPFDRHVALHSLTRRQTLELFVAVLDAVAYSHGKGVLHRDLKPANVMVDDAGRVHVLDFGLARGLDGRGAARVSATGQLLGTPAYMAPEQLIGGTAAYDVRVDVHALGVLLFETLTGSLPYPVANTPLETIEALRDREPASPPRTAALDDDLRAIVMRAVARDPERRYSTVSALADDCRLWLRGEAIQARSDSRWYVARKLAWRHRVALSIGCAFLIVLVTSLILIATAYEEEAAAHREQTRQREIAEAERDTARAVQSFWNHEVLGGANPLGLEPDPERTLRSVVDLASANLEVNVPTNRALEAGLRQALGATYQGLGDLGSARRHLERALILQRERYGDADPVALEIEVALGEVLDALGDPEAAERLRHVLATCDHEPIDGAVHARALRAMGQVHREAGRYDEAEHAYRSAMAIAERRDDVRALILAAHGLMLVRGAQGRLVEAEEIARRNVDRAQGDVTLGESIEGALMSNLADVLTARGHWEDAIPILEPLLERHRSRFTDQHPRTVATWRSLAMALYHAGRFAEAREAFLAVLERQVRIHGEHDEKTVSTLASLALTEATLGFPSATERLRDAARTAEAAFGDAHPLTLTTRVNLAHRLQTTGRLEDARLLYEQTLELCETVGTAREKARVFTNLGVVLRQLGRTEEALELYRRALPLVQAMHPPEHPEAVNLDFNIGYALFTLGDLEEASPRLRSAVERAHAFSPEGRHPLYVTYLVLFAHCLRANGALAEAAERCEEAYHVVAESAGADAKQARDLARQLVELHRRLGRTDRAEFWSGKT